MWIMSTRGFFSTVQHRDHPDQMIVRARTRGDIEAFASLVPGAMPYIDPTADYPHRLDCSKESYAAAVSKIATDIDYPNFKDAVEDEAHAHAYIEVWATMLQIDDRLHSDHGN